MISTASTLPKYRYGRTLDGIPFERIVQGSDIELLRSHLDEEPDYLLGFELRHLAKVDGLCCVSTLHLAIEAGQLNAVKVLLQKARECFEAQDHNNGFVDPGEPLSPRLINESGGDCGTPLDYALLTRGPKGIVGVFYDLRHYLRKPYNWLEAAATTDDADLLEQLVAEGVASDGQAFEAAFDAASPESLRRLSSPNSVPEAKILNTLASALGRRDLGTIALLLDIYYALASMSWRENVLQMAIGSQQDVFQWLFDARDDVWSGGDALIAAIEICDEKKVRLLAGRATHEARLRALNHPLTLYQAEPSESIALIVIAIAEYVSVEFHDEVNAVLLFLAALDAKAWSFAVAVAQRLDTDKTDTEGRSLLSQTVRHGAGMVLSNLLNNGWSLASPLDDRRTFLHLAASTCDSALVQILLDHGCIPDLRDRHGRTALHEACQSGDEITVRLLADPVLAVVADNRGWTPVAEALWRNHAHLAQAALGSKTALVSSPEYVGWMIALGADLTRRATKTSRLFLLVSPESLLTVGKLSFPDLADAASARDHFVHAVSSEYRENRNLDEVTIDGFPALLPYIALSALAAVESNAVGNELHNTMKHILEFEGYRRESLRESWDVLREWVERDLGCCLAWPDANSRPNVGPPIYHALWRQNELERLYELLAVGEQLPDLENKPRLKGLIMNCADRLPVRALGRLEAGDEARTEAMIESAAEWLRTYEPPVNVSGGERTRVVWGNLAFRWDHRREVADWTWRIPYREGDPEELTVGGNSVIPFGTAYQPDYCRDIDSIPDPAGYRLERPRGAPISFCHDGRIFVSGLLSVGAMGAVLATSSQIETVLRGLEKAVDRELKIRDIGGHLLIGPFRLIAPLNDACGVGSRSDVRVKVVSGLMIPGEADTFLSGLCVALQIVGLPPGPDLRWEMEGGSTSAKIFEEDGGLRVEIPSTSPGKWSLVGEGLRHTVRIRDAVYASPVRKLVRRHLVMTPRGLWTAVGPRLGETMTIEGTRKRRVQECAFAPSWLVGPEVRPCRRDLPEPAGEIPKGDLSGWRAVFKTSRKPKPLYQSKSKTDHSWECYKRA